jgi:hypothetical protein
MNEQEALAKLLRERQQELERQHRVKAGLESVATKHDKEQFARFVRQFERGCCGEQNIWQTT